ncbi:MAG: hypothetical protein JMN24_18945 [gamma proteobacterium endosymbiont of Lamellibrachia anaximandri]|nr:hypothetical protein [gamma proteobacterium endosymbiont of Lamellibrachia anaximandri]
MERTAAAAEAKSETDETVGSVSALGVDSTTTGCSAVASVGLVSGFAAGATFLAGTDFLADFFFATFFFAAFLATFFFAAFFFVVFFLGAEDLGSVTSVSFSFSAIVTVPPDHTGPWQFAIS